MKTLLNLTIGLFILTLSACTKEDLPNVEKYICSDIPDVNRINTSMQVDQKMQKETYVFTDVSNLYFYSSANLMVKSVSEENLLGIDNSWISFIEKEEKDGIFSLKVNTVKNTIPGFVVNFSILENDENHIVLSVLESDVVKKTIITIASTNLDLSDFYTNLPQQISFNPNQKWIAPAIAILGLAVGVVGDYCGDARAIAADNLRAAGCTPSTTACGASCKNCGKRG